MYPRGLAMVEATGVSLRSVEDLGGTSPTATRHHREAEPRRKSTEEV
jgi:hypothetical protein